MMEKYYDLSYKAIDGDNFSVNSVAYPALMKKRIKRSTTFFQPLYEAFSNSLEATNGKENHITIILNRSKNPNILGEEMLTFVSLSILDDGEGFTEENFMRFERLFDDSKDKNNLGSGRVQFLHFFEHTLIDSTYKDVDGIYRHRRIDLSLNFYQNKKSVIKSEVVKALEHQPLTSVSFYYPNLDDTEKGKLNKLTAKEIKDVILKRYLYSFCLNRDNLQEITIMEYINGIPDKSRTETITIEDIPVQNYQDIINVHYSCLSNNGKNIIQCIETEQFDISSYYLPTSILRNNEVMLTSKGEAFNCDGFDFSIIREAPQIEHMKSLLVLISSPYLTQRDSDVRGNLGLISKKDFIGKHNLFSNRREILIDDIEQGAINKIVSRYPSIQTAKQKADNNIRDIARQFSIDTEILDAAGVKCTDNDISVFKKVYTYNAEQKAVGDAKIRQIICSLDKMDPNKKDFQKSFQKKVDELNIALPLSVKVELSNYLARRTLVIELMEKTLNHELQVQKSIQTKGRKKKHNEEGIFHNLLFPQRTENVIESNLWMLNDEYIHYSGLSEFRLDDVMIGDEPLFKKKLSKAELEYKERMTGDVGDKRPDVLLFPDEGKCIIIEFKAPNVDVSKHLDQITQYATIIANLSNEKFNFKTFYGYLIGDKADIYSITDRDGDYMKSQSLGYVVRPYKGLADNFDRGKAALYTEIIQFSDLLKRAKLRNKVFSDKILPKSEISNKNTI